MLQLILQTYLYEEWSFVVGCRGISRAKGRAEMKKYEGIYDLVIKNGRIIDGTGSPSYLADVAVKDGKIARIGKAIENGRQIIDARGLVVTPGFIDSHSHSDKAILTYPDQREKIEQGITTSIGGQCGSGLAPLSRDFDPASTEQIGEYGRKAEVLRTMGSFLEVAKDVPLGANIAVFVGHRELRKAVMGMKTANLPRKNWRR